jgi:SAM-dependent methyltransferase
MPTAPLAFDGLSPRTYDECLGPFIFEPYALDLVDRIDPGAHSTVLELACGTGRLTQHLGNRLAKSAKLTATDINPGMLTIARERVHGSNIHWDTVDMAAMPFDKDAFDLVVCQFGLMFVPDKLKALKEMHRVLKTGGKLIFSVWGNTADNPLWKISNQVISSFLPNLPVNKAQGPFSMSDEKPVLSMLQEAGFTGLQLDAVHKTGLCPTAADAARGFVIGSPIYNVIMQNDPSVLPGIQAAMETAIGSALGEKPVRCPMQAWVFTASK